MESKTQERDEQFLDALEPLASGLGRFCRALMRDQESARDLAAETIRIAYEQFDSLREARALQSYLYTIATRLARAERKHHDRFPMITEHIAEASSSNDLSPELHTDLRLLNEAIEQLSEAERNVIILFEIVGHSLEEIRQIQGGSLSSVKMRLVRARKHLKQLLGVEEATQPSATSVSVSRTVIKSIA